MTTTCGNQFWHFETFVGNRIFDAWDAELINNRLSLEEMKRELHKAKTEESVARAWGDNEVKLSMQSKYEVKKMEQNSTPEKTPMEVILAQVKTNSGNSCGDYSMS